MDAPGARRRRRVVALALVLLLAQPRAGEADLNPGGGPARSLAGLAAWTSARRVAAERRLSEVATLAEERAAALDSAEAELGAATERHAGLLGARRALGVARDRIRAAREEGEAATRRLEGRAAAGLAALALLAHRDRGAAGAGREASTSRRAAAGGAVAPWADRLGWARRLDGEIARLAERWRELEARLDEAAPDLRLSAAAAVDARRLALDARREVAQAAARRDALGRRLGELVTRARLAAAAPSLERPGEGARAAVTDRLATAGLRSPSPEVGARGLSAAARASTRRTRPGQAGTTLLAFGPAAALAAAPAAVPVGGSAAGAGLATLAVPPIVGRRVAPEGEAGGGGDARHRGGILLETSVAQTVSAPSAGTVAFSGSFRGFGLLLIIDRGDGYHILLSGLSRLDVSRGATVIAGQAVGAIGVGDGKARLYVELRHRGTPVEPAGWSASREDRIRG